MVEPHKINPLYTTQLGKTYVNDSLSLLSRLPSKCVDLTVISPLFTLQGEKEYGFIFLIGGDEDGIFKTYLN